MEFERACLIYITNSADADFTRTVGKAKQPGGPDFPASLST
jgi:hypothetical protein